MNNKSGEKFNQGLVVILAAISISLFSFITEGNNITGFAAAEDNGEMQASQPLLLEFKDVDSLSTLAAGNYFVDSSGVVYWADDDSNPAIAKVSFVDETQKNRYIYIDAEGRVGYLLPSISIENEETIQQ